MGLSSPLLRVVVLIDHIGAIGGAEPLAAQLVTRLDPARFERTVVAYRRHDPGGDEEQLQIRAVGELRAAGVEVLELDATGRRDLRAWAPFARRLLAGRVDVLHAHKFGPNLWASLFSRLAPVPVLIAHEHTWSFEGQLGRRMADRWLIATRADAVVAVSAADRDSMVRVEHIPRDRIRVILNGIPEPAERAGGALRTALGIPSSAPVIGTVASLRPQKDLMTLVRAMPTVLLRHPEARLAIIGDGPELPALTAAVAELDLQRSVMLPGFMADAGGLVADFDVAVNTSTFEGSSLALLEYMAAGRAVVATDVGGNAALLGNGTAGVLVPPRQPLAVAEALCDLLGDPPRRAALGDAARARQRAEYDIAVQASRVAALYEELWSKSAAGDRRAAASA